MPDYKDLIKEFGGDAPISQQITTPNKIGTPYDSLIQEFGNATLPEKVVAPVTTNEQSLITLKNAPVSIPEAPTTRLGSAVSNVGINLWKSTKDNFQAGRETIESGISDITANRPASGVGKVALGAMQSALSPVSSALTNLVEKPVTEITGNPDAGEKASMLAGGVLPVSKGGQVISALSPNTRAIKDIIERVGRENLPQVISRLKSNPRLSLMDVSEPVRTDIQGLASKPELGAQAHLSNVVKERAKGERSVVEKVYTDVMGPVPNVKALLDDISESTKKVGKEIINPAVKGAGPVDIAPVLKQIDDRSKTGINAIISAGEPLPDDAIVKSLKDFRKYLSDDKQQLTDASRLHNLQSALRVKAETLLSSANGQDRLLGYELMKVRGSLVDAIDTASGSIDKVTGMGPYKTGLSKYRVEKEFPEAIEKGMQIFKNNPSQLENRPEFWQAMIKDAKDHQLEGLKIGARLAADNQIRGMRFAARKGENIPEIEFNAERLEHLFGKKEVQKLKSVLSDEKDIAQSNSLLFNGSKTASTLAGQQARAVRDPISFKDAATAGLPFAVLEGLSSYAGVPGAGTAVALLSGGARKGANAVGRAIDKGTNVEYAKIASASGAERDEVIKILESFLPKPKQSIRQLGQTFSLPVLPP